MRETSGNPKENNLQRDPARLESCSPHRCHGNESPTTKFWDRVRLVGAAILVCVIGGASFLAGEIYHINAAWLFLFWNSIGLFMILGKSFRGQFKNVQFTAFFLLWMAAHGTAVVLLMRCVRMTYWVPLMGLELFIGFLAANLLFGIVPHLRQ